MIAKAEDYSHYVSCDAASCFELLYRRDVAKTRKSAATKMHFQYVPNPLNRRAPA